MEVFEVSDRYPFPSEDGENLEPGFYWWPCFPGALPDSDPVGPFKTHALALARTITERTDMTTKELRAFGFDLSKPVPFRKLHYVRCSQCEALTINNIPVHETGCPNAIHECNGCNELIPINQKHCPGCC